jgi:hypothetical protein
MNKSNVTQTQYRTVESVQIKKYGPILILLEEFSPFALDESEVIGDLKTFKPGDILEKCGDKYIKFRSILQCH